MGVRSFGRRYAAIVALFAIAGTGCTPATADGKYYDARSGEFTMELKGGKVALWGSGAPPAVWTYKVTGDSLVIRYALDQMAQQVGDYQHMRFQIEKNGDLQGSETTLTRKKR